MIIIRIYCDYYKNRLWLLYEKIMIFIRIDCDYFTNILRLFYEYIATIIPRDLTFIIINVTPIYCDY